jgi:hypothetical protein
MRYPIQDTALHWGLVLVGIFLLYGAYDQARKGTTFGLAGNPRISRNEQPGWFVFLLVSRLVLGFISLGIGIYLTAY